MELCIDFLSVAIAFADDVEGFAHKFPQLDFIKWIKNLPAKLFHGTILHQLNHRQGF